MALDPTPEAWKDAAVAAPIFTDVYVGDSAASWREAGFDVSFVGGRYDHVSAHMESAYVSDFRQQRFAHMLAALFFGETNRYQMLLRWLVP